MLYHVEPPEYAPLLMQAIEFEKKLLAFVCHHPAGFVLIDKFSEVEQAEFDNTQQVFLQKAQRFLGKEPAKWLWERLYEKEKGQHLLTMTRLKEVAY